MIYIMGARMYWSYINEGFTHESLITYLNHSLNLRGQITQIQLKY